MSPLMSVPLLSKSPLPVAAKIRLGADLANPSSQGNTRASSPKLDDEAVTHLQKAQKAHLSDGPYFPGQWTAQDIALSAKTLHQVGQGNVTTDYRLATTDDTLRKGGGLLIAVLAGLGSGSLTLASKELLGLVAWFGVGMAAAPLLVNAVFGRTGVDFGQHYITSYNKGEERQPLLMNPEYLPTHLIPRDQRVAFMAREGISPTLDADAKEARIESAIQKRVIQRNTLWLLVAGPTTAVATALAAHAAQPLLEKSVPVVLHWGRQLTTHLASWTGQQQAQAIDGLAFSVAGKSADSRIAQWWGQFTEAIVPALGIDPRKLPVDDLLKGSDALQGRQARLDALVERFVTLPADKRQTAKVFLTQQAQRLNKLGASYAKQVDPVETTLRQGFLQTVSNELPVHVDDALAEKLTNLHPAQSLDVLAQIKQWAKAEMPADTLARFEPALQEVAEVARQRQTVQSRLLDGLNTLSYYHAALDRGEQLASTWPTLSPEAQSTARSQMGQWLTGNSLSVVSQLRKQLLFEPLHQLLNTGLPDAQRKLMGTVGHDVVPDFATHLNRVLDQEQVLTAADSMGAPPLLHLDTAVKQALLRNNWRQNIGRVAAGLGVGTIASAMALTKAPPQSATNPSGTVASLAAPGDLPSDSIQTTAPYREQGTGAAHHPLSQETLSAKQPLDTPRPAPSQPAPLMLEGI